ncbi:MAG TPA: NADAR family protein [Phycisphaerales bacterium]|nr:NADAR family protein [Phycisphaerales bacterium]
MTLLPEDIIALRKRSRDESFNYLFFWKCSPESSGVGPGCLSQWWPASFKIGEREYPTAEHFMMYSKAMLFGDEKTAAQIMETESCKEVKALGRKVENFDSDLWREHRFAVVLRGNLAKFSQNEELKQYIFSTGDAIIVEASPTDNIWGIGLSEDKAKATDPANWKGMNLLGFALMRTRSLLESGLEYVSEFINLGPPTQGASPVDTP